MSAIWGAIDLEGNEIPQEYAEIFHEAYRDCVIDRTEISRDGAVLMGCELQYFTPEAEKEHLPFREEDGSYFVADVYLDNREELLCDPIFAGQVREYGKQECGEEEEQTAGELPDGEILRRFFRAYGKERLKEVHGSFAFVSFDAQNQVVSLAMDHMANRCLYYAIIDEILYFSTLLKPIADIHRGRLHENRKFLQDFLAIPDMRVALDDQATIYFEIRHAAAGEILSVGRGESAWEKYWDPLKEFRTDRGKTDEQYREELREKFGKAVSRAMRSDGEIGIFLSGGLDSTAVASVASGQLKKTEKQLYAYTMIPVFGYSDDTGERVTVDEQALVHETAQFLGNVAEHYDSCEEINAWDCMERQLRLLEGPFKSLQNVMHLMRLAEKARRDGCRIVLNGQLGNDTISYGDQAGYLYEMFRYGHWLRLRKELNSHSKYFRYQKKKALLQIWDRMTEKEQHESYEQFMRETPLREYTKQQYLTLNCRPVIRIRRQYLRLVMDRMRFRQIGDGETKMSLYTGVLIKDPTRDVDFFEWCLHLPTEQFHKNCTNRRLIYAYMDDIMPPHILDQRLPKGRQSADMFYRLEEKKKEIYEDLHKMFCENGNSVVDGQKMLKILEANQTLFHQKTKTENEKKIMEKFLFSYEICALFKIFF